MSAGGYNHFIVTHTTTITYHVIIAIDATNEDYAYMNLLTAAALVVRQKREASIAIKYLHRPLSQLLLDSKRGYLRSICTDATSSNAAYTVADGSAAFSPFPWVRNECTPNVLRPLFVPLAPMPTPPLRLANTYRFSCIFF